MTTGPEETRIVCIDTRSKDGREYLKGWLDPQPGTQHLIGVRYIAGLVPPQDAAHTMICPSNSIEELCACVLEFARMAATFFQDRAIHLDIARGALPIDFQFRGMTPGDRKRIDAALDAREVADRTAMFGSDAAFRDAMLRRGAR